MSLRTEQHGNGRGLPAGTQRWLKQQYSRAQRRAAKHDPTDAPRQKRYRGYT